MVALEKKFTQDTKKLGDIYSILCLLIFCKYWSQPFILEFNVYLLWLLFKVHTIILLDFVAVLKYLFAIYTTIVTFSLVVNIGIRNIP